MRRFVLASILSAVVGCGGTQVPQHSGYKSEKVKPWKNAKRIAWDEKMEAKVSGDLSYAEMRRAKWFQVDVPSVGELTLKLEVTPPGDAVNEDFDLAMEILDPGNRVISKADAEEEDVGELTKTRTLYDLQPGHYLLHLYLQGRLDSADFVVRASYKRADGGEVKSDFPAQVAFLPPLPMVPISDDTPRDYRPPTTAIVKIKKGGPRPPRVEKKPVEPVVQPTTARIVNMSVSGKDVIITIGYGSLKGAAEGWKVRLNGIAGTFPVTSCTPTSCKAAIAATPDQIKGANGSVTIGP